MTKPMKKLTTLIFALILLLNTNINAQVTYLVKDISSITLPSSPKKFIRSGSLLYFSADNGVNGRELWRTDGTAAGTLMIKDINPGTASSMEAVLTEEFYIDISGTLFFVAKDSTLKKQLWKTDGTLAGTVKLTNISAGIDYNGPMLAVNGILYFFPTTRELWKSDGTVGGTVLIKNNMSTAGNIPSKSLINVNGTVFFIGYSAAEGFELWKTDGSTLGTVLVKDINPGAVHGFSGGPSVFDPSFTNVNGILYFAADNGVNGVEFWKSDGTDPGTVMVKEFNPAGNSNPRNFTLYHNEVFFTAYDPAIGYELWKTDGTNPGTVLVADLNLTSTTGSFPNNFLIKNDTMYFVGSTVNSNSSQLWKSDGTALGTTLLMSGSESVYYGIYDLEAVNNELYVSFVDTTTNWALWKEDTLNGTFNLVKDINVGTTDNIYHLTAFNGNLIFTATDSIFQSEIWISDGTTSGTVLLKDINQDGDSYIDQMADVNGTLFFSGRDNSHGGELWKSNGNATGTNMILDANPNGNANPYWPVSYHNNLYYRGFNGRLWKSDGTTAGTVMVSDSAINITNTVVYDDTLFFQDGNGVWRSDGTFNGTTEIYHSYVNDFIKAGNNLYLQTFSGLSVLNLSNNSVTSLYNSMGIGNMFSFKDTVYFQADGALRKTDGTVAGTVAINSLISIYSVLPKDDILYIAGGMSGDYGLFYTASPSDSISLLKEIIPSTYVNCSNLTAADSLLFFSVNNGVNGEELWVSNGTPNGTVLVKDVNASGSSTPTNLVAKNGIVYFSANDGIHGTEVWKSDGSSAGTVMLEDINLSGGSNPQKLTVSGDYIYFVANDGVVGKELWAYGINTTSTCFAYYSTTYDTLQNTFFLDIDPITESAAISYHWDLGDGFTSNLDSLSHTYSIDSVYNVCLRVYTSASDSCLYCHQIGVDTSGNIVRNSGFTVVVWDGPSPVGIAEIKKEANALLVAPNPSEGEFKVFLDNTKGTSSIRITNITGQLILEQNNVSGENCIINLRNQSSGIYFMEVENNGKRSRSKLIKQ